MAVDLSDVRIIITNETEGDRVPVSTPDSPQGTPAAAPVSQKKAEKEQDRGNFVAGVVVTQQVKPYVEQVIGFNVSQIQATTGSAELQQRMQVVSGAVSAVASIGMGAIVGGVPGAVVSTALTALNGTISAVQHSVALQIQRQIEQEGIDRKTSRLGQSVNRSRTGGVT